MTSYSFVLRRSARFALTFTPLQVTVESRYHCHRAFAKSRHQTCFHTVAAILNQSVASESEGERLLHDAVMGYGDMPVRGIRDWQARALVRGLLGCAGTTEDRGDDLQGMRRIAAGLNGQAGVTGLIGVGQRPALHAYANPFPLREQAA